MRTTSDNLLAAERGQVLVMLVFTITALFATAALVMNVGRWLQAKQLAQGTADSAALAAAQEDPRQFGQGIAAASNYADQNWTGSSVVSTSETGRYPANPNNVRTAEDVELTVEKNVPAFFAGLLQSWGVTILDVTARARAFAASEPVLTINQVSPLALYCDSACQNTLATTLDYPWPLDGSGPPPPPFEFVVGHPYPGAGGSSFSPIELPDDTTGNFPTYITCDPTIAASSSCNQTDATASNLDAASCPPSSLSPCRYPRLPKFDPVDLDNAVILDGYLKAAEDTPHLVAIYDDVQPDSAGVPQYHVIGWASVSFTVDDSDLFSTPGPGVIRLNGTFHKLFVDGSHLSVSGFGGSLNDFGVRAVGLVADRTP